METLKMKVGSRENITAFPSSEQVVEALASIRSNAVTLERSLQIAFAAAWFEFHTDGKMDVQVAICDAKLPSGLAASAMRVLTAISKHKPDTLGTPKKSEAVKFAVTQTANMFQHSTKERDERRKKAQDAATAKKAERTKIDAELKAANEALAALQKDAAEEPAQITRPTCALVDENGEVLIQLTPEEMARAQDILYRELRLERLVPKMVAVEK